MNTGHRQTPPWDGGDVARTGQVPGSHENSAPTSSGRQTAMHRKTDTISKGAEGKAKNQKMQRKNQEEVWDLEGQ